MHQLSTFGQAKSSSGEEQTDPLDFSCGGSTTSELIQHHHHHPAAMAAAAAAVKAASYGFVGRPPAGSIIHADYTAAAAVAAEQRSFYYRDSLGTIQYNFLLDSSFIYLFFWFSC